MRRITEFEINEQVFVPAGDGEPAQWKRWGDLTPSEFSRNAQGDMEAVERLRERAARYDALIDEAARRAGGDKAATLENLLTGEEIAALNRLEMTLDASRLEHVRRQAAIDRDIAAGRYCGSAEV